jgi:hypothetical protein
MANADKPRGLVPLRHLAGGVIRTNEYTIATGYNTIIGRGDPVHLVADGVLERVAATNADILGVFDGCQYTDANGQQQYSPYWPASTTATNIIAHVYDDPWIEFGIQVQDGTLDQTAVGANADFATVGNASTTTGQSTVELANSVGSGAAQCRILGLVNDPENAWGANCDVRVLINEHVFKTTTGV